MSILGEHLATWRKLNSLTEVTLADRAGVSRNTVRRFEASGEGTVENFLKVARVLGVMDRITAAVDPLETDVGRLRAEEKLPERVRPRVRRPDGSS